MLSALLINGWHTVKIERLSFVVVEEKIEDFLKADAAIWDPWLRQRSGFISKRCLRYPGGRVEMQIFWQSKMDQAKAADHPEHQIVEATFRNTVGHCFTLLYSD
jgi:uncharacterized protein (TIGR03792 family)